MSSNKKRAREDSDEDPEIERLPAKRQKIGDGAEKGTAASGPKATAQVVDDEESFDPENSGSDSFDDDFDKEESNEHADDDNFDVEAYKKWRLEHPDSDTPVEDDDEEEFEFDEGGESQLEDDDSDSDE